MGIQYFLGAGGGDVTTVIVRYFGFDSYTYACEFESGLEHCVYRTFGKSLHPVALCLVLLTSEDTCGCVLDIGVET